jgi:hypothetical protein
MQEHRAASVAVTNHELPLYFQQVRLHHVWGVPLAPGCSVTGLLRTTLGGPFGAWSGQASQAFLFSTLFVPDSIELSETWS